MSPDFYEISKVMFWLLIDTLKTNNLDSIVAKLAVISTKLVKVE
jgi:hypothetical protein